MLCPMELQDPVADAVRSNISYILDSNLAGPSALLAAFTEVQQTLEAAGGTPEQLAVWLNGEHSLQEAEAAIGQLLQVRCCRAAFLSTSSKKCIGWCYFLQRAGPLLLRNDEAKQLRRSTCVSKTRFTGVQLTNYVTCSPSFTFVSKWHVLLHAAGQVN